MSFSGDIDPNLVSDVKEEYKKAAFWLPFSALEINSVFNDDEVEELSNFIKELKDAGDDNRRKARVIERFSNISLKLMELGKIIL